jgi:hypothetical protein
MQGARRSLSKWNIIIETPNICTGQKLRMILGEPLHTGSLQSMATVKYLENCFSEILEIW